MTEEISREDLARKLEGPLAEALARGGAQDRVHYIVLAKGVPLRVAGTSGRTGTVASVDSELATLYRRLTGRQVPIQGFVPNPYFAGNQPLQQWKAFSHKDQDIFLVARIDGYTVADALGLIDRAASPAHDGRLVLDMKAAFDDKGNVWLKAAADRLQEMGWGAKVMLDTTGNVVRDQKDLIGYYSWGSNDPAIKDRDLGNRFVPGAIAGQFVSSDGRTFQEPPASWHIGTWSERETFFAGSPQSLAGDLIRQGVTGVAGHVAEPYLDATIRPDILFPAYLSGFTLGEAFYLAMPYVSWQTVVVGDPLATVASMKRPGPDGFDAGTDPATELPAWFAKRRLDALASPTTKPEALTAWLKSEARRAKGDGAGARKALEEAVGLDPGLTAAQLLLAGMYEESTEYAKAEQCYRAVLAKDGRNVVALNNLAYIVAVRQNRPADALPIAEKAYALVPQNGNVADTLAWVHHLIGNKAQSGRYIGEALRGEPNSAEVHLHAAVILLESGELDGAKRELARATELDPKIEQRDEAKAVRKRLP